jgi:hypothetical protein
MSLKELIKMLKAPALNRGYFYAHNCPQFAHNGGNFGMFLLVLNRAITGDRKR